MSLQKLVWIDRFDEHADVYVSACVAGFCGCLPACDCAEATRILSCHISVHVLEEKQALRLVCGSSKPASYTLDCVGKKKRKPYCFCQSDTRTKATMCSLLAACPLCKTVQVV